MKQQAADRHIAPLGHINPRLPALLSNKYQSYNLWIDPIGARTHDLPHSRQSR